MPITNPAASITRPKYFQWWKVVAIIGPSGCGKSTLLRTINMIEKPTSGTIVINGTQNNTLKGKALFQARSRIGFVFQQFNLFSRAEVRCI